jgi:hypothetical protein
MNLEVARANSYMAHRALFAGLAGAELRGFPTLVKLLESAVLTSGRVPARIVPH